ncbi:MAG: hypothetical protein ABSA86_03130 [Oryzomonas sp.]|jgi:hypothetical protein
MKKTIFSSVLMLVVLVSASAAMAATSITGQTTLGNATNSFTPSTKVGMYVAATQTTYAATSCHVNGTYEYGTVGGSGTVQDPSKIYQGTIKAGQSGNWGVPDQPTDATQLPATPSAGGTWQ